MAVGADAVGLARLRICRTTLSIDDRACSTESLRSSFKRRLAPPASRVVRVAVSTTIINVMATSISGRVMPRCDFNVLIVRSPTAPVGVGTRERLQVVLIDRRHPVVGAGRGGSVDEPGASGMRRVAAAAKVRLSATDAVLVRDGRSLNARAGAARRIDR